MDKVAASVANPLGYKHDKKKGFQVVAPQKVREPSMSNLEGCSRQC